jgi:serine/threonine protein kinase/Tol biopolymer transport system component
MKMPDYRERIKELFHEALQLPTAERVQFLSRTCEGDASIREEVESLISAHDADENFLEVPAFEMAAEMLAGDSQELTPGQQLGPYTILSSLGFGGMGEVYLAQDVRLNRKIALKLMAWEFAGDDHRARRFEQEAQAASALNHPNVCVIHEVGKTANGRHFMAMEFIDGITLRRRMAQKRLTLKEVLDVAAQVTWALEAAHAAGIIHRDIKPENIMLRRDGYVKVLDFGVAKFDRHPPRLRGDLNAETAGHLDTAPGTLLGTAKYMSPEQLREQPIDRRSDIWSLGVVLHEMVTGFTPFEAPTTNDIIAVILEKQPPRLSFHASEVPEEFQRIVRKALSKKRRERYQTISELSSDLSKLRRQISGEDAPEKLEQSTLDLETTISGPRPEVGTWGVVSTILSKVKFQAISTADYVLSEIKQHKTAAVFSGFTVAFALLFIGLKSPNLFRRAPSSASPPAMQMTPLTNSGKSVCAAISPDGKFVAHAESKNGMQELLVTSIATSGTSVVVPPDHVQYRGVTFSRDGNYLYFTRSEKGGAGTLYQVALPGSAPRKIKEGVDSPITFSPTGDRFGFVRFDRAANEYFLMIAGIDGTNERTIATRRDGNTLSVGGPAWSPDEDAVVCSAGKWDRGYHENLIEFAVENGKERLFSQQQWYAVLQVAWLDNKSGLIVNANERPLSPFQLWRVSYPQREVVRITNDTDRYQGVSLSRNGEAIVSLKSHQVEQIFVAPEGDAERAGAIVRNVGRVYGVDWTNNGKIVYSSTTRNNLNLSAIDRNGSNQIQLTLDAGDNIFPAASPDGRFIVFVSNRTGSLNIWRINADDGSDPKQLTFSDGNSSPSVSPDGQWVLYDNQSNGEFAIWKVPIDGGQPVQIGKSALSPVLSPDGQFIACRYYVEGADSPGIAILPFQGEAPLRVLPIPVMDWQRIQWTPDGRALTFIKADDGRFNIWRYELVNGSTTQLTDFKTDDQIFAYAWSPDYKELACERGIKVSDVLIIYNQK